MKQNQVESPLFTRPEATAYLRVSIRSVDEALRDGTIGCVRVPPNSKKPRVLFRKSDLDAFITRHVRPVDPAVV